MGEKTQLILYLKKHGEMDMAVYRSGNGSEAPLAPGHVCGPAIRDCYFFQYCTHGTGTFIINDLSFPIRAGQCFVMFPGSVVYQKSSVDTPWAKTWICLYGRKISSYLDAIGITENNPVFPWEGRVEILEYMRHIIEVAGRDDPAADFLRISCANMFFALLTEAYEDSQPAYETAQKQLRYINQALRFIEENVTTRISVTDLANHLCLNRTYFSGLFTQHMGCTPLEFIHRQKVQKACDFFANPRTTVESVAYSLGYDPRVFIRIFKKVMGMTPGAYRNSSAKETVT